MVNVNIMICDVPVGTYLNYLMISNTLLRMVPLLGLDSIVKIQNTVTYNNTTVISVIL